MSGDPIERMCEAFAREENKPYGAMKAAARVLLADMLINPQSALKPSAIFGYARTICLGLSTPEPPRDTPDEQSAAKPDPGPIPD